MTYEREQEPRGRQVNWISDEDMLPKVVPRARIWAYNYNSNCFSDDMPKADLLVLADVDHLGQKTNALTHGDI